MKIYVKDKELPKKTCENCPLCEYFDKDAHGKGKHEVACLYEGTFNNILFGDKLCPENCNIIKSLEQHEEEIRKPLEDEIIELKEHIRALKSSHDLSHQAYLFAKNEGLDLQKQARLKVIAELEEFENEQRLRVRKISEEYPTDNEEQKARLYALSSGRFDILAKLKQKLKEMKGEK